MIWGKCAAPGFLEGPEWTGYSALVELLVPGSRQPNLIAYVELDVGAGAVRELARRAARLA